jgi:hypothetical protein
MGISINDIDAETLKRIGLRKPKSRSFTAEQERQYAIKVLNVIHDIKQGERARVLKRAISMNNV